MRKSVYRSDNNPFLTSKPRKRTKLINAINYLFARQRYKQINYYTSMESLRKRNPLITHQNLESLIRKSSEINIGDEENNTPLILCIKYKEYDLAKLLIKEGAEINIGDYNGDTPLMLCIQKQKYSLAKFLIQKGANVNQVNNNGNTALMMFQASHYELDTKNSLDSKIDMFSFLTNNGANLEHTNKDAQTLLMVSINNEYDFIKFLLSKYKDINAVNTKGETVLINAINYILNAPWRGEKISDYDSYLPLLIQNGAEVNIRTKENKTPLIIASEKHTDTIVDYLIQNGAKLDEKILFYALTYYQLTTSGCKSDGKTDSKICNTIKYLLEADANIDVIDKYGNTPFRIAVYRNSACIIKLFIHYGVDVTKENINIQALFEASLYYYDDFELSNILLKNTPSNISLDDKDSEGNTILLHVIQNNHDFKIIDYLLNKGADIEISINQDSTINALTLAMINKKEEIYKLLRDKTSDTLNTLKYLLKNDLYFEKEYFKNKLNDLLSTELEYNIKLYLLESWSYFDKRIDVDKIDKCIFILDKLDIWVKYDVNSHGIGGLNDWNTKDDRLKLIKQRLEASLHSINFTTFESILKKHIVFPEKAQGLSEILQKFSSDKRLQYTNHDWDTSTFNNEITLNYDNFIDYLKLGWKDVDTELKIYAPQLHSDIESFFFDKIDKDTSLFGTSINCGWSSEKVKKANLLGASEKNKPEQLGGFKDILTIFKNSFVIKESEKRFLSIMQGINKKLTEENTNFNLKLNLSCLKKARDYKVFTDVQKLEQVFVSILKEINDKGEEQKVKITLTEEAFHENKTVVLKIIHIDSNSKKSAQELADNIKNNGGRFDTIYNNLKSICDWSIDTKCKDDKRYKIDYLYPDIDINKPHITEIDTRLEGFTYILRFYI